MPLSSATALRADTEYDVAIWCGSIAATAPALRELGRHVRVVDGPRTSVPAGTSTCEAVTRVLFYASVAERGATVGQLQASIANATRAAGFGDASTTVTAVRRDVGTVERVLTFHAPSETTQATASRYASAAGDAAMSIGADIAALPGKVGDYGDSLVNRVLVALVLVGAVYAYTKGKR